MKLLPYILYALLIALMFGLVALVDWLFHKLFPKPDTQKYGEAVRMPRFSSILGVLLTLAGVMAVLFVPLAGDWVMITGCILALGLGLYLLINFFRFGIFYDDAGFIYRTLTKTRHYTYDQIKGQRSFMAKSGVNTTLYVAEDEISLYSAMQGLSGFLSKAFYRWCAETGTDPETVENNPAMLVYFPEPKE